MRIEKIRIIPLKQEYLETLEGEDKLTKIVDERIDCEEEVEHGEEEYSISSIAIESFYCNLYSGENLKNKKMISDLFLGDAKFQYPFTRWEIEMNVKNPTKEQVADYIVNHWFYPIDPNDVEEIEKIAEGQMYAFHDCVDLKYISEDRVKEIAADFDKKSILKTLKDLEKELNKEGIFMDALEEDTDLKLLDDILRLYKKCAEENRRVLYIHIY